MLSLQTHEQWLLLMCSTPTVESAWCVVPSCEHMVQEKTQNLITQLRRNSSTKHIDFDEWRLTIVSLESARPFHRQIVYTNGNLTTASCVCADHTHHRHRTTPSHAHVIVARYTLRMPALSESWRFTYNPLHPVTIRHSVCHQPCGGKKTLCMQN